MIVVYPFSVVDQNLALKNAQWIQELGGCKGHECLMIADARCASPLVGEVQKSLALSFDKVHVLIGQAAIDGWPEGANYFFRLATSWMDQRARTYPFFMWLEPDAIPMKEKWLDLLELEYHSGQRPFMGDRVQVEDIPLHMSGVGIYPNPLHAYAGEAYRAAEVAWDMAGKDQIVPKAHFTKLIEHAWKHPKFTSIVELETQIRTECILFHSSKDGSLIDLLRSKRERNTSSIRGNGLTEKDWKNPVASPDTLPAVPANAGGVENRVGNSQSVSQHSGGHPTCDIFIRTYPGDYEWLRFCLQSVHQFCTGFRKVWIVSPADPPPWYLANRKTENAYGFIPADCEWKVINDETEDGYLSQQITKLYADVLTDYQSDYILHVDSDVILTRKVTPMDFFELYWPPPEDRKLHSVWEGAKPVWYFTPYEAIQTPWKAVTEKFMQFTIPFEFMRRLPMIVPRWLYPRLREFAYQIHRQPIAEYIKMQPPREFSEFNALGAYAYFHHKDKFHWVNTTEKPMPEPCARQFHSWDGITPGVQADINEILRGAGVAGKAAPAALQPEMPSPASPQIKELPSGVWVLAGDQISEWVEQEGRLDHDQNLLPCILKHIDVGNVVLDIGAHIGDHTIAYVKAVGVTGLVHAFEPNPISWQCLTHNVSEAVFHQVALGDKDGEVPLSGNNGHPGGGYIGEHMKVADVKMKRLDDFYIKPDFIKIDVEGYELQVLHGAEQTIQAYHPRMVIEINLTALLRQGTARGQIFDWLNNHGYQIFIIQENCNWDDPLYDILCLPVKAPEPSLPAQIKEHVRWLKATSNISSQNKSLVMQQLVYAGLKEPNPKNIHKNKRVKKAKTHPVSKETATTV